MSARNGGRGKPPKLPRKKKAEQRPIEQETIRRPKRVLVSRDEEGTLTITNLISQGNAVHAETYIYDPETRDALIQTATGGLHLANAGDVPPGSGPAAA